MATNIIKAQTRETIGKKLYKIREQGLIPAVLYGSDIKNKNITIAKKDFMKLYDQVGSSSLVDLEVGDDKSVKTLIQDLQYDPVSQDIIHVDFYQIKEGKKINTAVGLEFKGEAPAVKEFGGILVQNYDELEIECLPKDLENIDTIVVDLSVLKTLNDAIHIKDLQVPPEIKILQGSEQVVVLIATPKEEKEEEPVEVPAEGEAVEGEAVEGEEKSTEKVEGEDQAKKEESAGKEK